jgi:hypothetical protein
MRPPKPERLPATGTSLAPTGLRPTGLRPTGLRPTGLRPTGLRPTGLRPTGLRPTVRPSARTGRRKQIAHELHRIG